MNHDLAKERMALRLYGELDEHETRELEAHLAGCDACRAFSRTLAGGVGQFVADAQPQHAMPSDWEARLRRATLSAPNPRSRVVWWAAAAGFMLGAATVIVVSRSSTPRRIEPEVAHHAPRPVDPGPTPRSTAGPGPLARLGEYLAAR